MPPFRFFMFAVLVPALAAGCASNGVEPLSAQFTPSGESQTTASTSPPTASGGAYAMSADEQALDCKKLTGRIQIRILELRTYSSSSTTSALSRGLQAATSPAMGGTMLGINPSSEHARDLAQVEAYNHALADKNCRSFDLAAALSSNDTPPTPTVPPRSK